MFKNRPIIDTLRKYRGRQFEKRIGVASDSYLSKIVAASELRLKGSLLPSKTGRTLMTFAPKSVNAKLTAWKSHGTDKCRVRCSHSREEGVSELLAVKD